jgi:hypothetical protein
MTRVATSRWRSVRVNGGRPCGRWPLGRGHAISSRVGRCLQCAHLTYGMGRLHWNTSCGCRAGTLRMQRHLTMFCYAAQRSSGIPGHPSACDLPFCTLLCPEWLSCSGRPGLRPSRPCHWSAGGDVLGGRDQPTRRDCGERFAYRGARECLLPRAKPSASLSLLHSGRQLAGWGSSRWAHWGRSYRIPAHQAPAQQAVT